MFCHEVEDFTLTGSVYFDQKHRFKDDWRIRTPMIVEFVNRGGYSVTLTSTGGAYLLVPQSPEELFLDISQRVEHGRKKMNKLKLLAELLRGRALAIEG